MTRSFAMIGLLLVAACTRDVTPPPAGTADPAVVEREVRDRLALPAETQFSISGKYVNDNSNVICGSFTRSANDPVLPKTQRFVAMSGFTLVDQMMAPGEMDKTISKYCANHKVSD